MALKCKCELFNKVESFFDSYDNKEIDTLVSIFNQYCDDTNNYEDRIYNHFNDDIEAIYQNRIDDLLRALSTKMFDYSLQYFYIDVYGQITSLRVPSNYISLLKDQLMDYLRGLDVNKLHELLDLPMDDEHDQNQ